MPSRPEISTIPAVVLPSTEVALVITCEHAGNMVPTPYRQFFNRFDTLLKSHRGFDSGALAMAKDLSRSFSAPLVSSNVTRLLVDLNRSLGHRDLHAPVIRELPEKTRLEIIEHYYDPYRRATCSLLADEIAKHGTVVHISCHSFTENLNGITRHADIGLLYDPVRKRERSLCSHWKSALRSLSPNLEVRRNYPYEGRNDGITSALRKTFSDNVYCGIEIEINQKNISSPARRWRSLRRLIITSLAIALEAEHSPPPFTQSQLSARSAQ